MIELNRSKENKWILQKNVSSVEKLEDFVEILNKKDNKINHEDIKERLRAGNLYKGRSREGSSNTMGVRSSQVCFYMLGYKKDKRFFPSPMTNLILEKEKRISESQIALINLYSMQFPSPYSKTNDNFNIYMGRLFIKLLLDKNLDERLYIDECIFFLMFLEEINQDIYDDLVSSILSFRNLSFEEKYDMFKSIANYDDVFSNATHEMNYYFIRLFNGWGVFDIVGDEEHNSGNLFKFRHGKSTIRTDAYASRKSYSGYITLNNQIKEDAIKLNMNFSTFDLPLTQAEYPKDEWVREIYEFQPLEYIETIMENDDDKKFIIKSIKTMVHESKYGTRDGKSFENSLKPIFEMFRENREVEIISGSGDTDLLCIMDDSQDNLYKINVDAKTSRTATSSINPARITNHININGSDYCIIVSPRFASGVKGDIKDSNIVTIEAETLADYCLNECLSSKDMLADFESLDILIRSNMGTDITKKVNELIDIKFDL